MYCCSEIINLDTEFHAPPDCPRDGDVDCKIVSAECRVVERWGHWATVAVRFVLKLRVRSHCKESCIFMKEVLFRESVWLSDDLLVADCKVTAAICKCVSNCRWIHCNLTARIRFLLKHGCQPHPHHHHDCDCHCREHRGCAVSGETREPAWSGTWHDEESDWPGESGCCPRIRCV